MHDTPRKFHDLSQSPTSGILVFNYNLKVVCPLHSVTKRTLCNILSREGFTPDELLMAIVTIKLYHVTGNSSQTIKFILF